MDDTIVYLIRHAETVDENGIRNTNEDSQMINEKEILNQRRKKQMKSTELLNTKVIHKMLGEGIITEAGDNYVTVKFASKVFFL